MHSSTRERSRVIAIHHNGDWSGQVNVTFFADPNQRTDGRWDAGRHEWYEWTIPYGEDLLAGGVGDDPRDTRGEKVPLGVITEAISIAVFDYLRSKAVSLIEQL